MKQFVLITAVAFFVSGLKTEGATAYLSAKGFGEGAALGNPEVTTTVGASPLDLHLYFLPGSADAAYLGIGFDVKSSTAGVANLTSFSVLNPDILVGATDVNDRWNGTGGSLVTAELISNFTGVSVDKAGLDIANDGSGSFLDAGYDSTAGAFYFGKVTLDPIGLGTTDLNLAVGSGGIARLGDQPQPAGPTASITFGSDEPTAVLGDEFGSSGTVFDARINVVVPEPSSAGLIGLTVLLSLLRRRR